jgi:hypothetical protein
MLRAIASRGMDREDLRLAVYRSFADSGTAPHPDALASQFDVSADVVRDGLEDLAAARQLALDANGCIVMAHPFSSVPLGFSVMGTSTVWWGGCAWDSFAMPHLLTWEPDLLVATRCPACEAPHAWNVGRSAPPPGSQVAHFLVPASRMWDDVVHTCANQRIFCSESCVEAWLHRTGEERGYVTDLTTLWRLASDWYTGRLDRGYQRREPAAAAAYLRDKGLAGPFWGL